MGIFSKLNDTMENKANNNLLKNKPSKEKRLRTISGILFLTSIITAYFSRRREISLCVTRIYTPEGCGYIYYIWELVGLAILLFITGLNLILSTFQISKILKTKFKISSLILFILSGVFYYFAEREKPCMQCRVSLSYPENQETIYGKLVAITILIFLSGLSLLIHSFRKEKKQSQPANVLATSPKNCKPR